MQCYYLNILVFYNTVKKRNIYKILTKLNAVYENKMAHLPSYNDSEKYPVIFKNLKN